MGTKDKVKNTLDEMIGKIKKLVGDTLGNPRLQGEGKTKEVKGEAKQAGEKAKDTFEK